MYESQKKHGLKPAYAINKELRRIKHRENCVNASNIFIEKCEAIGAKITLFGSLATSDFFIFREDSDVDLCVMNEFDFNVIEEIANNLFKPFGIKYDLWRFQDLKKDIQQDVLKFGIKRAFHLE